LAFTHEEPPVSRAKERLLSIALRQRNKPKSAEWLMVGFRDAEPISEWVELAENLRRFQGKIFDLAIDLSAIKHRAS